MSNQDISQQEYESAIDAAKCRHPSYVGSPRRHAPIAAEPRYATGLARHGRSARKRLVVAA